MSTHLRSDQRETWLELTLNRPDCRNALSRTLIGDLTTTLQRAGGDAAVHSVILTAAPPAFCAGLDLREVATADATYDNSPLLALFETIEHLPKPVIAAVNGPAIAGGAGLVSVCDLAIASDSAGIGYSGVRRGLVAPIVMTYLCRLVGERQARFLLLTGQTVSSRRALEMGLLNEVVPDGELMGRARQHAAGFAECSPHALAQTKALLARLHKLRAPDASERRGLSAAIPVDEASRAGVREFLDS